MVITGQWIVSIVLTLAACGAFGWLLATQAPQIGDAYLRLMTNAQVFSSNFFNMP